jgi:hypothetical protein
MGLFEKDKTIERKDYDTRENWAITKNTTVVPKTKNRLMCIFLSTDKGAYFIYRTMNVKKLKTQIDNFIFREGIYIIDKDAIYLSNNGAKISVYIEGVSTPIKSSYIKKHTKEITINELDGTKHKQTITFIDCIKADAKIIKMFVDEQLARNFTTQHIDRFQLIILILSIVSLIMIAVCSGISYYFR